MPPDAPSHLRDPDLFLRLAQFLRAQAAAQDFGRYTKDDLMQFEIGAQIMYLMSRRVREKVDEQWALRGGKKMLREMAGENPFPKDGPADERR